MNRQAVKLLRCPERGCRPPSFPSAFIRSFSHQRPLNITSRSHPKPSRALLQPSIHRRYQHTESPFTPEPSENDATSSPPIPPDTTTQTTSSSTNLPWYLAIPPTSAPSVLTPPAFTPSDIPSLPPNPPPCLPPLLTYLYTTLGLDSLTLLDLRPFSSASNPATQTSSVQSALGPNLIMLICTARSLKHLNVSADRLCRWFRTSHKISPYADGLLGRNELKIKLRRKARRIKLAASVGALSPEGGAFGAGTGGISAGRGLGSDDGITTGWICVNVGEVPGYGERDVEQSLDVDTPRTTGRAEEHETADDEVLLPNDSVDLRVDADVDTHASAPQGQYQPMGQQGVRSKAQERIKDDEPEYENPAPSSQDVSSSTLTSNTVSSPSEFTIAGFGHESTRPRIVVQMFTEEKRAEMDLEGLWDNRLARLNRVLERDGNEGAGVGDYAEEEEEDGFGPILATQSMREEGKGEEEGMDGEVRVKPFEGDEEMEKGFVDVEATAVEREGEGEGLRSRDVPR